MNWSNFGFSNHPIIFKRDELAISNKRKATLPLKTLDNSSVNQNPTKSNTKLPPCIETTTKTIPTLTQVPNSEPPLLDGRAAFKNYLSLRCINSIIFLNFF